MQNRSILFLVFLAFTTCSQEEITSRAYPRVMSRGIEDVSKDGALFKGEITFAPGAVDDYGFLWSNGGFPKLGEVDKVSLGPRSNARTFEARIEKNMGDGETCTMRAYAKSGSYVVYGELMDFVSQGCKLKPLISGFSPMQGSVSDIITIEGDYFSLKKSSNAVLLGTADMEVIEATESEIKVKILPTVQPGSLDLTVISNGNPVKATEKFIVN